MRRTRQRQRKKNKENKHMFNVIAWFKKTKKNNAGTIMNKIFLLLICLATQRLHAAQINIPHTEIQSLSQQITALYDAVVIAPQHHKILYEDETIRMLLTETKPGEKEPAHMHYWPRLLIIFQGAEFEIEYADGKKEREYFDKGNYQLPADTQPTSYKNCGNTTFKALSIEYK